MRYVSNATQSPTLIKTCLISPRRQEAKERYVWAWRHAWSNINQWDGTILPLVCVRFFFLITYKAILTASSYTCACTSLALHIEKAMATSVSVHEKLLDIFRIHSELEYLRELSKMSSLNKWSLQMFEKIIRATGLSISMSEASTPSGQEPENGIGFNLPCETPGRYALQPMQGLCPGDLDFTLGLNIPDFELPFDFQFGPHGPNNMLNDLVGSMDVNTGQGLSNTLPWVLSFIVVPLIWIEDREDMKILLHILCKFSLPYPKKHLIKPKPT